jgi:glycosyltransferase involved in cell wall biosynthesis
VTARTEWITCQIGAREHYAVPRALHRYHRLRALITDAWAGNGQAIFKLPTNRARRLRERFHPDLDSAEVRDFTAGLLKQEIEWRLRRRKDWELLIARNEWFQREAAAVIDQVPAPPGKPIAVFAYSYAARDIFRAAKRRGWTTVLGQIDPGQEHFTIVRRLADASPQYGPVPSLPPIAYFESWREECALADHVVVNSEWSRQALARVGVGADKVRVLPLAYEPDGAAAAPPRVFPDRFTAERPLRLLFVGSVSVVKGVAALLEAMLLMRDQPVVLRLVGEPSMVIPEPLASLESVELSGAVPRGDISRFYAGSDILVFPSHSDGFGIVQIEAQAAGLPIIASTASCCPR